MSGTEPDAGRDTLDEVPEAIPDEDPGVEREWERADDEPMEGDAPSG